MDKNKGCMSYIFSLLLHRDMTIWELLREGSPIGNGMKTPAVSPVVLPNKAETQM